MKKSSIMNENNAKEHKVKKRIIATAICGVVLIVGVIAFLLLMPFSTVKFEATPGEEPLALIETRSGEWSYLVTPSGNKVVKIRNKDGAMSNYSEGLLRVTKANLSGTIKKYGFVDTTGKEVIPCKYDEAHDFHEGLAAVRSGRKWGFINTDGAVVIPYRYERVSDFHNGFAVVSYDFWFNESSFFVLSGSEISYVDVKGNEILPASSYVDANGGEHYIYGFDHAAAFDGGNNFSEGFAAVVREGSCGYIDEAGSEVIPCQYYYAGDFHEGLAVVKTWQFGSDSAFFIDSMGERQISFCDPGFLNEGGFRNARDFSEGLAAVQYGMGNQEIYEGKWGFINHSKQMSIPFQYDDAGCFSEGLAAAKVGDQWGYIDTNGETIIKPAYKEASDFKNGYAVVYLESGDYCIINRWGQMIITENDFNIGVRIIPSLFTYPKDEAETLVFIRGMNN